MPIEEITYHADYSNGFMGTNTIGRKAKHTSIPLGTFYDNSKYGILQSKADTVLMGHWLNF